MSTEKSPIPNDKSFPRQPALSGDAPPATRIGVAIVEQHRRVLVGVRAAQQVLGGLHEFPGGKCHPQESPAECALRECCEETGLRVDVAELLSHVTHDYSHGRVELFFYLCLPVEDSPLPQNGFRWVPICELATLNFPEGNRDVVAKLLIRDQQHSTSTVG
jgi:mutator protein MutT